LKKEEENDEGQATPDLEPCTGERSEDLRELDRRRKEQHLKKEEENDEGQATPSPEPCLRETKERSGASSTNALASPPGLSKPLIQKNAIEGLTLAHCVTGVPTKLEDMEIDVMKGRLTLQDQEKMPDGASLMKQETSSSEMEASDRKVCDAGCTPHLYDATADQRQGRRMGKPPPISCWWYTSTEHGGWRAQGQKVRKEDTAPQLPPWGKPPRRDRGKSPREAWRKRGGEQQRKPWYNQLMAQRARNKGRGKGRPSDDAWF